MCEEVVEEFHPSNLEFLGIDLVTLVTVDLADCLEQFNKGLLSVGCWDWVSTSSDAARNWSTESGDHDGSNFARI